MLRVMTLLGRKNLPVIGKFEANPGGNQKPVNNLLGAGYGRKEEKEWKLLDWS